MLKELKHVDVSRIPELLDIAEEVRKTNQPRLLRKANEDLAIVVPLPTKRGRKGRPTSADDPLWGIAGMADSKGPRDVSENVDEYLAEAYADKHA